MTTARRSPEPRAVFAGARSSTVKQSAFPGRHGIGRLPSHLPPYDPVMPRILFALVLAASAAAPAAAQSKLVPADSAEVANHQVTEAEFARVAAIVQGMDRVYQSDPGAFRGLEGRTSGRMRLDSIGAQFESRPAMRAELARGGMTGREFVVPLFALVNASQDRDEDLDALPSARAANVRFARSREAEIGRLFLVIRTVGRED